MPHAKGRVQAQCSFLRPELAKERGMSGRVRASLNPVRGSRRVHATPEHSADDILQLPGEHAESFRGSLWLHVVVREPDVVTDYVYGLVHVCARARFRAPRPGCPPCSASFGLSAALDF